MTTAEMQQMIERWRRECAEGMESASRVAEQNRGAVSLCDCLLKEIASISAASENKQPDGGGSKIPLPPAYLQSQPKREG